MVNNLRRNNAPPEMATIAWAKMYECLGSYDLLPEDPYSSAAISSSDNSSTQQQSKILTVHVCEAPGAFIAATNHFIRTHRHAWADQWVWMGNSLNPYHEANDPNAMIDDDALIAATPDNWCFGQDDSGDIRRPANIRFLWQQAAARAGVALAAGSGNSSRLGTAGVALMVTGDGSVDCQENPNEQEAATAALHYCEFVAALGLLAPGGNVLLKMFTLFEHSSVCMLYLAGCMFEEVHVVKPCSSKPGNSETYLVGLGFKGCPEALLETLLEHCGPSTFDESALVPLEALPAAFLASATKCGIYFGKEQQQVNQWQTPADEVQVTGA